MSTLWILVANRSFAKVYEVKGHGRQVTEIHHLDNPDGHKKNGEIFTDRPGRSFDSHGASRHALVKEIDTHEREQKNFTKKISEFLQHGKDGKKYEELAFVAPAHFLGELHSTITPAIKKSIVKEVHKDLPEHLTEQDRIEHLCKYLDLWNHNKGA